MLARHQTTCGLVVLLATQTAPPSPLLGSRLWKNVYLVLSVGFVSRRTPSALRSQQPASLLSGIHFSAC